MGKNDRMTARERRLDRLDEMHDWWPDPSKAGPIPLDDDGTSTIEPRPKRRRVRRKRK